MSIGNNLIGVSPLNWCNEDDPTIAGSYTFEHILSEVALAGFSGCEIGNTWPKEPDVLLSALNLRQLKAAAQTHLTRLATKSLDSCKPAFLTQVDYLTKIGASCINVWDISYAVYMDYNVSIFLDKPILTTEEWFRMCAGLREFGKIANASGLKMCYHHHLGTVVHTEQEIDVLLNDVSPELLSLCFDNAHFDYFGVDSGQAVRKYASRIGYVHLKDIRKDILAKSKLNNLSFMDTILNGVFTVPGDGDVSFAPIFDALSEANYQGWLTIEADQDPTKGSPLDYAIKGRKYVEDAIAK